MCYCYLIILWNRIIVYVDVAEMSIIVISTNITSISSIIIESSIIISVESSSTTLSSPILSLLLNRLLRIYWAILKLLLLLRDIKVIGICRRRWWWIVWQWRWLLLITLKIHLYYEEYQDRLFVIYIIRLLGC